MAAEITKDTIERFLFKLLLLALVFAAGIGANALGGALYWFIGAGAIFLVAGFLYLFNLGRLKIVAKDASDLASQTWGRQFVNLLIISFGFGSGVAAAWLGGSGLWRFATGGAGLLILTWLYVKGRFRGLAEKVNITAQNPGKKKSPPKEE